MGAKGISRSNLKGKSNIFDQLQGVQGLWATLFIIGKSITDSNLSNFLLIRFLATDPMYITYNNSVAARYLT